MALAVSSFTVSCKKHYKDKFQTVIITGNGSAYLDKADKNALRKRDKQTNSSMENKTLNINTNGEVYIDIENLNRLEVLGNMNLSTKSSLQISSFSLKGAGNSNILMDVNTSSVAAETVANSALVLSGTTRDFKIKAGSSAKFSGFGLTCFSCTVDLYGDGDCEINATDTLNANIYGEGDIIYKGDPKVINIKIDGSGKVIKQ